MATLCQKTIGTAMRILQGWKRDNIERFFYENDVPKEMMFGNPQVNNGAKLDLIKAVLWDYADRGEYDRLHVLIGALVKEASEPQNAELEQCLMRDGFAVADGQLVDAEPEAEEQKSAVVVVLDKYPKDFDRKTLTHHLTECEDLFRQEKWDSSIGHCRNFVEQLLSDVAGNIAAKRGESAELSQPVHVRNYLEDIRFFDAAERRKLVNGVYGYFSEEGAHPGISTQSAARVSKSILLPFAFYVLEKYDAWKTGGFQLP